MTVTVRELVEHLSKMDQDAIVEVSFSTIEKEHRVSLDLEEHIDYTDFRGNRFVSKDAPHYNKRYVAFHIED